MRSEPDPAAETGPALDPAEPNRLRLSRRRFLGLSVAAGTLLAAAPASALASPAPPAARSAHAASPVIRLGWAAAPRSAQQLKVFRTASTPDIQNMDPAAITGAPDYQIGEAI